MLAAVTRVGAGWVCFLLFLCCAGWGVCGFSAYLFSEVFGCLLVGLSCSCLFCFVLGVLCVVGNWFRFLLFLFFVGGGGVWGFSSSSLSSVSDIVHLLSSLSVRCFCFGLGVFSLSSASRNSWADCSIGVSVEVECGVGSFGGDWG